MSELKRPEVRLILAISYSALLALVVLQLYIALLPLVLIQAIGVYQTVFPPPGTVIIDMALPLTR